MHRTRKRFGQHFLHDRNIIDKIIRAIDPREDDRLVEIGPGQGALTFPLLKQCKRLIAIELDRDLIPRLQQKTAAGEQLKVINADILKFELDSLPDGRFRIVGNLPYNISTPLMFHLLDSIEKIQDMHFMVQKEVARRIVASVGTRNYGRLSVMIQNTCDCQYLFDVAPASFTPPTESGLGGHKNDSPPEADRRYKRFPGIFRYSADRLQSTSKNHHEFIKINCR